MSVPVPTAQEIALTLDTDDWRVDVVYGAEVADQARRCRVPYNEALAAALVRRVQRAAAMQNLPLGVLLDESGSTRLGSTDPEVRRLEAPYRRMPVG